MPSPMVLARSIAISLAVSGPAFAAAVPVSGQSIEVRHDHDPWGSCEGVLTISADGIRYDTDEDEHARAWDWVDIQGFDRKSATAFSILTYEDLVWHAGLDRNFDFDVIPGGGELSEAAFATIAANLARPVTDRVPRAIDAEYEVPAKHLHAFGGCEGVLRFGPDWIVYDTDHAEDRRSWNRHTQLVSVWSPNPYEIELRVIEEDRSEFDKEARFTFQLKERIDSDYYDSLRRAVLLGRALPTR